jgi:crotonobetainyl-CoA:carnitine CoA-transferase CaiB-like acyl-CoA transferase
MQLVSQARATKLLLNEKGNANGVLAKRKRKQLRVMAKSVIIASGGFAGNKQLLTLNHLQPDPYWKHFCQTIEREDIENDPRFNSLSTRSENSAVLINIIDEAFAKRTLEEWKVRLLKFGLIFSPVQKPTEVVNDPQARANDFFETFTHPVYGPIELVAAPIKLSETPGTLRTPAPEFGQHTEEILLELGYSWGEISWLRDKKVIA